jgi:hypothetical protein
MFAQHIAHPARVFHPGWGPRPRPASVARLFYLTGSCLLDCTECHGGGCCSTSLRGRIQRRVANDAKIRDRKGSFCCRSHGASSIRGAGAILINATRSHFCSIAWNLGGARSFPQGKPGPERIGHGRVRSGLAMGESGADWPWESHMNGVIYLVGLVVVVLAILSLLGLR